MSNQDIKASLKNKLSPFWILVDMMTLPEDEWPETAEEYAALMEKEAIKAVANKEEIVRLINSIK